MKRLLGTVLLVTFLNGCSGLPLVSTLEGSLSINGAIAGVTGKYEHQAANALVNLASHKSTGKTVSQHLYAAVENKYTKKRLEKHFKNKELSVTNFEIANTSIGDYFPTKKTFSFLCFFDGCPLFLEKVIIHLSFVHSNNFKDKFLTKSLSKFSLNEISTL